MAPSWPLRFQRFTSAAGASIGRLIVAQPVTHVVDQQALGIHQPEAPGRILSRQALTHHGIADLIGDS